MRVHLIGVAGTGMGQLAQLFCDRGDQVTGSDIAFDPPMGPALEAAGIRCLVGYDAAHVEPGIDLVVVGNAVRKDNAEAVRAEELGLRRVSMSAALRDQFMANRKPLVVCGTHGKTTTTAMCAWIFESSGFRPGYFIGGLPKNFQYGANVGSSLRKLVGGAARPCPFVVEGDEYDAVFWNKRSKFFDYVRVPGGADDVVILTSIEHDHVDIYPSREAYEAAFVELISMIPERGHLVCDAHDPRVVALVEAHARARVTYYAVEGDDTHGVTPTWLAVPLPFDTERGVQSFDLYLGGSYGGRCHLKVPGTHNVRNALASLAACTESFGVSVEDARRALATFEGVRRRQDLLGSPNNIALYDDFAHHPTAVDETLRALRSRHPSGTLWAVFEPRSATACRNMHQEAYGSAFRAADQVILAPLGRTNIAAEERLDIPALARALGDKAMAAGSVDVIVNRLVEGARAGDTIALLSNGAFGGIHSRLLEALGARS